MATLDSAVVPPHQARLPSLATRSAVLYSVLVGGAVLLAGWLIGDGNREGALASRKGDLEHRARTVQVRLETEIRSVENDVRFLSGSPFLRDVADVADVAEIPGELIARAEETLAALLAGKPSYAQCRLLHLSEPGMELIRIDQREGAVMPVAREDLQAKGHRDYFKESAGLGEGEIYLSPINLNREFGGISLPHTPTLRSAAKVFDRSGRPFGLVVINVDLRPLFAELRATAGADASLYVANAEGDYLVHPDASKTFGFDLGARHRLADSFGPEPISAPQSDRELLRFVRFTPPLGSGRELVIGVGAPRAAVLGELTRIRNRSMATALAAALLAAVLVWSLAAKVERQVEALDRARRVADENRRAKEEFLATLSHEIRTPMNAVTGLVHALATDRPSEHQAAALESLQFASRKLIAVVNDVLDFSKIEAGKLAVRRAPFDLRELLDNIRAGNLRQAEERGLELVVDPAPEVPRHLVGDSLRLYQILNNLVQNALKFTPAGGRVKLSVAGEPRAGDDGVRLAFRVQDNGVGMDARDLERALSRFGQTGGQRFGGTGLGLPISKQLVELQGGRFRARSSPGEGSTFRFELDFGILPEGAELPATGAVAHRDLRGRRILCVEDVASNRLVMSALLDPTGVDLEFSEDAAGALAHLRAADALPDLILLDLQLPDRDGASLAVELREGWPAIPVIGLTAQTGGELLDRCKRAGVTRFVWKPVEPQRFYEAIGEVLVPPDGRAPGGAGSEIDASPVRALFDGDAAKAERFLTTLADELDEVARALPGLVERLDAEGVLRLHHRLQNGLRLVGATAPLDALAVLAEEVGGGKPLQSCLAALADAGRQLRSANA